MPKTIRRPLEEIDPAVIDQVVRAVCAEQNRAPDKEMAIASHLASSRELMEWAEMMAVPSPPQLFVVLSAIAIGLEIGYQLGQREADRKVA